MDFFEQPKGRINIARGRTPGHIKIAPLGLKSPSCERVEYIPDVDDYAQRINHGIESAHNFVYVMAPRCMTSPYCLIEFEYARLLGKRVIPINQMVIFDTPEQQLSAGDQQV